MNQEQVLLTGYAPFFGCKSEVFHPLKNDLFGRGEKSRIGLPAFPVAVLNGAPLLPSANVRRFQLLAGRHQHRTQRRCAVPDQTPRVRRLRVRRRQDDMA